MIRHQQSQHTMNEAENTKNPYSIRLSFLSFAERSVAVRAFVFLIVKLGDTKGNQAAAEPATNHAETNAK